MDKLTTRYVRYKGEFGIFPNQTNVAVAYRVDLSHIASYVCRVSITLRNLKTAFRVHRGDILRPVKIAAQIALVGRLTVYHNHQTHPIANHAKLENMRKVIQRQCVRLVVLASTLQQQQQLLVLVVQQEGSWYLGSTFQSLLLPASAAQ